MKKGFSLVEIAVVLVIIGLFVSISFSLTKNSELKNCYASTQTKLETIRNALNSYAARENRYPAPAARNVGVDSPYYGRAIDLSNPTEAAKLDSSAGVTIGALPFQSLTLPIEYASDCWGNKYTYAVTTQLTDTTKFQASETEEKIIIGSDLTNIFSNNTAYIVISHGQDEHGAVKANYSGATKSWCANDGTIKTQNCSAISNLFIAAPFNDGKDAAANYFDDIVIYGSRRLITGLPTITAKAYAWGYNTNGRIGNGTVSIISTPNAELIKLPTGVSHFLSLVSGTLHSCGIGNNNKTYCWGNNMTGQVGINTATSNEVVPKEVMAPAGIRFSSITVGSYHTCAIGSDGNAYCWGQGINGQLGNTALGLANSLVPILVDKPAPVSAYRQIAAGASHTCAITDGNEVYCWGNNFAGKLGDNTTTQRITPAPINSAAISGILFDQVALGGHTTCALAQNQNAYCWGWNAEGEMGDGTYTGQRRPITKVGGPAGTITFTSLSVGATHACGDATDNRVYCWGKNDVGQLGVGSSPATTNLPLAVDTPMAVELSGVSASDHTNCAQGSDNRAYCWGKGDKGQIGDGFSSNRDVPTEVSLPPDETKFTMIGNSIGIAD